MPYESSIYTSTPILFWICIGIAYLIGIIVLLRYNYKHGWLILVSCNLVVLSLYILRGYDYWGVSGDVGIHLGWIHDILNGDGLDKANFYPLTHILSAGISMISGINAITVIKITPLIFSILYYIGIYLCVKEIVLVKVAPFVLLLSIPFIDGSFIAATPSVLANLSFPIVLWCYLRSYKQGIFRWVALALFLIFPIFHFITWVCLVITIFVVSTITKRHSDVYILLAVGLAGLFWLSYTNSPDSMLRFINPLSINLEKIIGIIKGLDGKGASISLMFFKTYGVILVYGLLAIIGAFKIKDILLKSVCYTCIAFIMLVAYLHFTQLWFDPMRFYFFASFLIIFPAGYGLSMVWERLQRARWAFAVLVVVILVNSVMMVYESPYKLKTSLQVSQVEVDGMEWFIDNKDRDLYSGGWYYAPECFAAFILTKQERKERSDLTQEMRISVPYHLGYDKYDTIGQLNETDWYLVVNEKMKAVYKDTYAWLEQERLTDEDWTKLSNDSNAKLLYSKGGFEVYYIKADVD